MDERERRDVARRAARAGAVVAHAAFRGPLDVETKSGPGDLVTEADRDAQRAVLDVIEGADPGATVVAEEDDTMPDLPSDGAAWVVDPIDGTRNFVAGMRIWATSVAAVVDGKTVGAASVMPALGDDYALGPDGVTRNGEPVSPSGFEDPEAFSVGAFGWWPPAERAEFERVCGAIGERFGDLRRVGCAQAALAMVASGELEGLVGTRPMAPWDTLAGVALVERAGGTVTDPDGEAWHHDAAGLVASNGRAHEALLDAAQAARE